jgi:hypothetical protein
VSGVLDRPYHRSTTGNIGPIGGTGSFTHLGRVVVGTGVASAVLTVYDGQSASGTVVSVIDASAKGYYEFDAALKDGVFAVLSGGNADVTVLAGG